MKVLLPISTTQEFKVRPRLKVFNIVLEIRNEASDAVATFPQTGIYDNGFLNLQLTHDFEEGEQYEVNVQNEGDEIWRGKIYITAQTPEVYKLNDGILTA